MSKLRWKKRDLRSEKFNIASKSRGKHRGKKGKKETLYQIPLGVRGLRWLNPVFFWMSIAFFLWLLVDMVLRLVVPFGAGLLLRAVAIPIAAFIGPLAIGYGAAWLSAHMFFYPLKKTPIWQGVLPARSGELVAAVVRVLKEHLLTGGSLRRYIKTHEISPELLPRLTNGENNTQGDKEFQQALRIVLQDWIVSTLERDDAKKILKETVGNVIESWHAQRLVDKPLEWSKNIWRSWLETKVLEAFPAIPDAMVGATENLNPWLEELRQALQKKGAPIDKVIAQSLSEGIKSLDVSALVHARLSEKERKQAVASVREAINNELQGIQAAGGLFGLLVGLMMRISILRGIFLVLVGVIWMIYRLIAKKPE